jgi:nitrogen regulatory protein PII
MKLVLVYIRQEQLPAIKEALAEAEIFHYSVMPILGTAPRAEQRTFRGVEQKVSLFKRMRMELFAKDADLERYIEAISKGAMERGGAGRIFVLDVADAVKIWTGERGDRAI